MSSSYPSGTPTGNSYLDSLIWGGSFATASNQTTTVKWAIQAQGTTTYSGLTITASTWATSAQTALQSALNQWDNVCNLNFQNVSSTSQADIVEVAVSNSTMTLIVNGTPPLGFHETPDGSYSSPLHGFFNAEDSTWTQSGLQQGGDSYYTLLHELGHAIGLAHPHDGGRSSDAAAFPGVTDEFYSYGQYGLNQAIWSVMSYNTGWIGSGAAAASYGGAGTPMALDIAAIQAIYGANTSYNTGTNTYTLPTSNTSGTFWSCIWDAGGTDTITNSASSTACTINLNTAPLVGEHAGGYVSYISGIAGGFTIANGATIENAIGGSGNDTLTGNDANNTLTGGSGNDTISGGSGTDYAVFAGNYSRASIIYLPTPQVFYVYTVSSGTDVVSQVEYFKFDDQSVSTSDVISNLSSGLSTAVTGVDGGYDLLAGNSSDNTLYGGDANDVLDGGTGNDTMYGGAGNDTYYVDSTRDKIVEITDPTNSNSNSVISTVTFTLDKHLNNLTLLGATDIKGTGNELSNTLIGNDGNNSLDGGNGDDSISGGDGDDRLFGGKLGNDSLSGGNGNDSMQGEAGADTLVGGYGNDVLDGGKDADILYGGDGNDRLSGGKGADSFVFDTAIHSGNIDTITDFKIKDGDKILLSNDIFLNYSSTGGNDFATVRTLDNATGGSPSGEHLIYVTSTHSLYYDPDGVENTIDPVMFAKITGDMKLSYTDFTLF